LNVLHQTDQGLAKQYGKLGLTSADFVASLQQYVYASQSKCLAYTAFHSHDLFDMDSFLIAADTALRTLFAKPRAAKACPTLPEGPTELNDAERRQAAGLMRVNHVGEVCAQALYASQALATPSAELRKQFNQASADEVDHLAWTAERLQELGSRPSILNPLWYAGAFGLGLLAGRMGNAVSLGFVVETETQVGAHLKSHLDTLPAGDHASRALVAQMYDDEMRHATEAQAAGAVNLP
jgi:ubiquinone biosynthesis monooxygenase Coq7